MSSWTVPLLRVCWAVRYPPRLSPSGPRSIRHSSICPYGENISRMSFSLHFLEIIPINSFLSSTAVLNTTQHQTPLLSAHSDIQRARFHQLQRGLAQRQHSPPHSLVTTQHKLPVNVSSLNINHPPKSHLMLSETRLTVVFFAVRWLHLNRVVHLRGAAHAGHLIRCSKIHSTTCVSSCCSACWRCRDEQSLLLGPSGRRH